MARKRVCLVRDLGHNNLFDLYGARGKHITVVSVERKYLLQAIHYWGFDTFKMVEHKNGKLVEVN